MKLVHPLLEEPILFKENTIPLWIIENQTVFSALIAELSMQTHKKEGQFVLSQGLEIIPIDKSAELIIDPFSLQPNNKNILGKLYKQIERASVGEEFYPQTMEIRSAFFNYLEKLLAYESLPLRYKDHFDLTQFFKNLELEIDYEEQSIAALLPDYLKTAAEMGGVLLFVLVNLKSFLSPEELSELYAYTAYEKINILLLENMTRKSYDMKEEVILFDQDLCRII